MRDPQSIDKQYLWHPFTQMQDWIENEQLVIEKGKGTYLYDTKGKRYLDGISSLWVTVHGHHRKELNQAITKQLNKIAHTTLLGLANLPSIELAEKLIKIAPPGLKKVFYSDNGSTAVEVALKIAFQYQQLKGYKGKQSFLTLVNAYHGDTIGSVSVGGMDLFHKIFKPLLFNTFKNPAPYCYRCPLGLDRKNCKLACINCVERILKKHNSEIAAMIVEPMIQAAAGMLTMPKGYLRSIRQLCTKYNVLLICDEVATGFGRTGKMFACEQEAISPDLMCVAKGITGGYLPLAATLTTQNIFDAFLGESREQKTFFHGHTYTGNPLACAAAIANLALFKKEKTLNNLKFKINLLKKELKSFYHLKSVGEIRQCGFMVGIELVKDNKTGEEFPNAERIGHRVILEARKRGAILRPLGDVIVLLPPLSINQKQLKELLSVTYESIKTVTS